MTTAFFLFLSFSINGQSYESVNNVAYQSMPECIQAAQQYRGIADTGICAVENVSDYIVKK